MSNHSMQSTRAAAVVNAHHQAQAQNDQKRQQFQVGQQAVQYKNAMIRTAQSGGKPGSMAQAMMAKLKQRPKLSADAEGGVQGARTDSSESLDPDEQGGGGKEKGGGEEGEGGRQGQGQGEGSDKGGSGGSSSSHGHGGGKDDSPEGGEGRGRGKGVSRAGSRRTGFRTVAGAKAAGGGSGGGRSVNAASAVRSSWADAAMEKGGLVELRSAMVDRLLRAARGSDLTSWRKDWVGTMAAAYAARYGVKGEVNQNVKVELSSEGALLNERSKAVPAPRMLPHRARETMFCLMWLVTHQLKCPRTPSQVKAMLPCLAALMRISAARRFF